MNCILTAAEIAKIRKRTDAATPGPWQRGEDGIPKRAICDAAFLAAAITDVPALCDTVDTLRDENTRLVSDLINADRSIERERGLVVERDIALSRVKALETALWKVANLCSAHKYMTCNCHVGIAERALAEK